MMLIPETLSQAMNEPWMMEHVTITHDSWVKVQNFQNPELLKFKF